MRLTCQEDLIKIQKREYVFFENEVSGTNFNQINIVLGLKHFEKAYEVPRKFASPNIQTSLVLVNLVTHLQSPGCGS